MESTFRCDSAFSNCDSVSTHPITDLFHATANLLFCNDGRFLSVLHNLVSHKPHSHCGYRRRETLDLSGIVMLSNSGISGLFERDAASIAIINVTTLA